MKRTISILVIIAMMLASVLAIIPVGATEGAEGGDSVVEDTTPVGTAVATADEFKAAVEAGKDFYLTDNIVLPADWAAKNFGATFDGNEKTVTLSGTAGLFAVLDGATIKNVAVIGETTVNGIANGAKGAVRFENVTSLIKTVQGDDKAAAFVGGQISPASITFVKCTNYTNVVGGLTGGAFASWVQAGDLVFEDCSNFGNVKASYAGGFVGAPQCANITVKNAINGSSDAKVVVEGSTYTGGLFGESYANITIDGLANYVHAKNGSYISAVVAKTTKNYTIKNAAISEILDGGNVPAGGVLGYVDNNNIVVRIENVTITGQHNVKGAWNRINGGFVGHVGNVADNAPANTSEFYFVDCLMSASTPTNNCNYGGFFGGHHNANGNWYTLSFVRCINNSDITMGGNIGGFVGQCNAKSYYFEDCVNNGNVNSTGNQAGGFFGWGSGTGGSFKAIRCINNGKITTNNKNSAGFASNRGLSSVYFEDCVNNGELVGGVTCGFIQAGSAKPQFVCCVNNFAGAKKQFSDKADEIVVSSYLKATPTATTLEGAINVFFNDITETKDKNWIGLVKEGETSSTAWAYAKDLKTGFNILDLTPVEGKTIDGGYYYIYFVPNDANVKEVIDGTVAPLAEPIKVFLADNLITKPEDLLNLKEGGVYALAADLTLPADYIPVDFAASLDGDGHTITLTGKTGLFNVVKNASIKNLTINAKIESDANVGALAVTTQGNVAVDNVTVKGSIKGSEIAGFFQYVNAEGTNVTITNSKNDANLIGTAKTAGFIAYANKNAVIVIDNCVNNGTITRVCKQATKCNSDSCCGYNAGAGFIANPDQDSNVTIKNSVNNGAVTGNANVAGFTGYSFGKITLENCVNNGYIELTNSSTWAVSAAGLVAMFGNGGNNSVLTIKGCTNNADVHVLFGGYEGVGGMVGSAKWVTNTEIYFEDSVNVGDVIHDAANGNYGGFLGWGSSIGTVSFKNCTNYGSIKGTGNNGGFLGQVGARKLMNAENCVNYGDITSDNNMPGGFAGWCNNSADGKVTIDGFTNYGVITAGAKQASACLAANDNAVSISIKNVTNYGYIKGKTGAAVAIAAGSKAVCENIVNEGMMTGDKIIGEFTNNGTFGEFIEINNAEDFLAIKPGFNYKLMNNIVLPEDYVGGTFGAKWYTTEFDGNGKTIYMKGLKSPLFDTVHSAKFYNFKVVGSIEAPAVIAREISNFAYELIVTDVVVDVDINNSKNTGGFFEWVRKQIADDLTDTDTRNIAFTNCAFLGNITTTGGSRTGGFGSCWELDNATLTFNNCVVGDKGLATAIKGKDGRVAGFVGKIEGMTKTDNVKVNFNNCVNYADVAHTGTSAEGASGAYAGRVVNVNVTLNNCDNYGDVTSNRTTGWIQGLGGLVGEANRNVTILIDGSNNYGNVYARRSVVGGLLGAVTNASKATIKNSANFGNVENGKDWNFYAGGIVGSTNDNSTGKWTNYKNEIVVDNCQNYGNVTTQNANTGGVVGGIEGAGNTALLSVTNCANYGKMNLVGGNNVGGIIGQGTSGTKTIVEGNVNYGYIAGATSNHGVAAIMALPYATANELIVKNNANYGIVEGGAGSAYVAGITADTNAGKYTYEGNVNYGTIIGTKENTSGICSLINDKADSTFAANYNYGIIVAAKANLVGSIPANVDAGNNYAGGVVVTNADNQALVMALASPYNYDVMGAGRDAWMDLVAALAAAEGAEIPEEPAEKPEFAINSVDFTALDYIIRDWKSKEAVSAEDYNKLFTNTITADTFASKSAAGNTDNDKDDNAKAFYAKLATITENSYYELTFKAKNNRDGGYSGFVIAADAENHPWFVYGGISNHGDDDQNKSDLRARYRYHNNDGSIGSQLSSAKVQLALDLDAAGFASYKVVYEGLTATVYALVGGEWTQVVFGDMEAFTLTEGSSVAIGVYNRHGLDRQRTTTVTAATLIAGATEVPVDFEALNYQTLINGAVSDKVFTQEYNVTANGSSLATSAKDSTSNDSGDDLGYVAATEYAITADTNYVYEFKAKLNRSTGYAGVVFATKGTEHYFIGGAFANDGDHEGDAGRFSHVVMYKGQWESPIGNSTDNAFGDHYNYIRNSITDGMGTWRIVYEGLTVYVQYLAENGEWTYVGENGERASITLPEGCVVALGAHNRGGNASKQRTITIADATLYAPAVAAAPATFALARTLSVEDAIAALVNKTALNEAKVELAAMGDVAEDDAKAVALKAAIEAMEKATTQAEIDNAAATLDEAVKVYVDLSALNYQLAEAEKHIQTNYTAGTWYEFTKALEAAKAVDVTDQAAVDAAAAALDAAIYGLADISELTDMTQKAIARAEALVAENFGTAGWAVMLEKLAVAKQAFADLNTELMDKAVVELNAAIDALISVEELKALIAELSALDPANYSVVSLAPVAPALAVAATTVDPVTQAPVDNAVALLRAAKAGLVDVTALNAAIAEAEAVNGSRYTAVSYANLVNVLASAKLVIMSADDAAEVEAATAAVVEAQTALRRKTSVVTEDLEALIEEAEAFVAGDYTAETWAALKDALSAAKVAVYADSQAKVRNAETALQEAIDALVIKPALVTDALAALIAEVEALDFTKYTTETWSAVSAALIEAKVALRGDDQAAIDAAKAVLDEAKAALAEKPVVEPEQPTEKPTEPEQPTEKPTEKPTEPADDKGCGSAIGATVVVMTAVLGLGATVVLKKKED